MNYCERGTKRQRCDRGQNDIERGLEEIKIKVERITYLKRSIDVLNRQHDKREVMHLDDDDIDEFNKLLEARETHNEEAPANTDVCEARQSNIDDSDDIVIIGSQRKLPPKPCSITTGIAPMEIDGGFSLEYTYVTDVSSSVE